ncbi:MAG: SIR2 family protein, partial [Cyclobacteriaceae bacterium]
HERITSGIFSNILTTNYEYTLESCLTEDLRMKNLGIIRETKYNIYRHSQVGKVKFWHIHGDMYRPSSILLGYEQYSGQLQVMRNYVVSGTNYHNKAASILPLNKRMGEKDYQLHSWIDHFFSGDLHIIGLSLDYIESDLWWLITYRSRQIHEKPGKGDRYRGMRTALQKSAIYYYYPEKYYDREKIELMEASNVNTVSIPIGNSVDFYHEVLDRIESKKT